jgi:hypothetical protein
MKVDRTTKGLLLIIALALWFIALAPMFRPVPVAAAHSDFDDLATDVKAIAHDVHSLYNGTCLNKMCE